MDLNSKKIIDYDYSKSMIAELALKSIKNKYLTAQDTTNIIPHSDLGIQYTSKIFEEYPLSNHIIHTYSRRENPYDNACIELFHSILKKEEIHYHKYYDFKIASKAIFEYIESCYNRKRIHNSLNYMTPQAFEDAAKTTV